MKRFFAVTMAVLLLCVFGTGASAKEKSDKTVRIGVLDMQKLQQKSKIFQKVRDQLKSKFDDLQKKLDNEKTAIMQMEEELKKQSMMLSLDAREDKQRELDRKKRHYKYSYDEYTQEMKEEEVEATRRVSKEIEKVVEKIALSEGYTIILEAQMTGLVYYDNTTDLTDQVAKAYDESKGQK